MAQYSLRYSLDYTDPAQMAGCKGAADLVTTLHQYDQPLPTIVLALTDLYPMESGAMIDLLLEKGYWNGQEGLIFESVEAAYGLTHGESTLAWARFRQSQGQAPERSWGIPAYMRR